MESAPHTVEHHRRNMLRKWRVSNTAALLRLGVARGVLKPYAFIFLDKIQMHEWHPLFWYDCDHFVTGKYGNKEEDIGNNRMNRRANLLELRRKVGKPLQ